MLVLVDWNFDRCLAQPSLEATPVFDKLHKWTHVGLATDAPDRHELAKVDDRRCQLLLSGTRIRAVHSTQTERNRGVGMNLVMVNSYTNTAAFVTYSLPHER